MMVLSGLSLLAFGLPMILTRESAPPFASLLYFACIGLGYILVELVLIQHFVLFLGFPTYALSVVLAGLLLSSGLGARLSEEVATERGLEQVLGVAVVVIAVGAFGLQPLLRSLISLPLAGRVAIALFVLLPIGGLLGFAMPLGLRRLERQCEGGIPYAWGINGVASVLASVVGALTALSFGVYRGRYRCGLVLRRGGGASPENEAGLSSRRNPIVGPARSRNRRAGRPAQSALRFG